MHHAGNSSGVVDGAAAILLASPAYAKAHEAATCTPTLIFQGETRPAFHKEAGLRLSKAANQF
ncbi:hypothetical protein CVM73_15815 [Bradyrhizobium forestalis]|uniref:Thiolase N-terminal domain-containing protein n=1 Tax=Bradyrhizobium forestalis TaxID=1419263 RepID=A0A2M8R8X9_9BRAD|nr:hypothetical protein [Bradyrhizobium forestalis]PJG54277.1 hypothetical protein CVM73_15815 [Bradyrhizobium forestalis]